MLKVWYEVLCTVAPGEVAGPGLNVQLLMANTRRQLL